MNTRAFTLALLISFLAMFMVYTYIEDQENSIKQRYGTERTVVVAKTDIKELELIDDSKLAVKSVPQNFVSPGAFTNQKELENTVATVPILKGEQITKPRVTYPGAKTGLSRQVSVGKRAIAIGINEIQGVSKLIKPGDRVDIIAGIDYAAGRPDKKKTQTVLQDVLVLSTGMSMTNSIPIIGVKTPDVIKKLNLSTYTRYNTITVELNPFEVQKLLHITKNMNSEIYLSLRNNTDKEVLNINSSNIYDVLGGDSRNEVKKYFMDKYKDQQ